MRHEIWRWSNLGLLFLVELTGLAIFAWWGWNTGRSTALRLVLAIGLPVIAAVLWGLFAAPTADYGSPVVTAVVKIAFFGLAGVALWTQGHQILATAFVLVVAANHLIIRVGQITANRGARSAQLTDARPEFGVSRPGRILGAPWGPSAADGVSV